MYIIFKNPYVNEFERTGPRGNMAMTSDKNQQKKRDSSLSIPLRFLCDSDINLSLTKQVTDRVANKQHQTTPSKASHMGKRVDKR